MVWPFQNKEIIQMFEFHDCFPHVKKENMNTLVNISNKDIEIEHSQL
jgi:hypothetical protein